LAATTFINNVITQIIERQLLQGLIKTFSALRFYDMSDQKVEDIAAEDSQTRERRLNLRQRKAAIETSLEAFADIRVKMPPEWRQVRFIDVFAGNVSLTSRRSSMQRVMTLDTALRKTTSLSRMETQTEHRPFLEKKFSQCQQAAIILISTIKTARRLTLTHIPLIYQTLTPTFHHRLRIMDLLQFRIMDPLQFQLPFRKFQATYSSNLIVSGDRMGQQAIDCDSMRLVLYQC
jgi:hypothetical protein